MGTRIRPVYEAALLADRQIVDAGRELRIARIGSGKRQADVGRAIGLSASQVSRIERGRVRSVSYTILAVFAGAVGLRLSLKAYPSGRRLLDEPQLALLRDLRARAHPTCHWSTEVPMPIAGDFRAADAISVMKNGSVVWELWTRLSDFQAQSRAARLKKRDLNVDRLVIVLRGTHANRRALLLAEPATLQTFPVGTRGVLRALAAGRLPDADGIALL